MARVDERFSIVFVCGGNTCSSPMAQGILRKLFPRELKPKFQVFSAGVSAFSGGEASSMPISLFIERSGGPYELVEGEVPEIGYLGPGYTGNHTYMVPIAHFNLSREIGSGTHRIMVKIIHNCTVISEDEENVIV